MSKHVLLIDDDSEDAEIFSDALGELRTNFTLSHFDDGLTALDILKNNALAPVDIIFLDINMPKIDGWESLREIKKIAFLQNIPIVMYSTSNFSVESFTPDDVGATAFLTKPDDFGELKRRLEALLSRLL